MKLIAKAPKGKEFLHSRKYSYFASDESAETICNTLNESKQNLSDGEIWRVYDFDYGMTLYVSKKIELNNGVIETSYIGNFSKFPC